MENIKNDFIGKIQTAVTDSIGVYCILGMGQGEHAKIAIQYPEARFMVGAGHPNDKDARVIKFAPTHRSIQNKLDSSPNLILELYLTEIMQHWYDFLLDLYENSLNCNFFHGAEYPIPKARINIDLSLKDNALYNQIITTSLKDFDFLSAGDKLKTVKKILAVDLNGIESDIKILKTNIQVRNILQHRLGYVNEKDLSDLGCSYLEEDHGSEMKKIKSGEKVSRTVYDLEELVNSLTKIANKLVA